MLITDDYGVQVCVPGTPASNSSPPDPDDFRELNVRVLRIEDELLVGATRMARTEAAAEQIRSDLEENTKMTKEVLGGLGDVVEFFTAMKGAFKVLNWVGAVAKPIAGIVGVVTAVIVAWKAWNASP